jgi:FdhE protein
VNVVTSAFDSEARAIVDALAAAGRTAVVGLPEGVPDPAAVEARLEGGVAALTGEPLATDADIVAQVERLAESLHHTAAARTAARVATALHRGAGVGDSALASMALAGAWENSAPLARTLGIDAASLATLLDHAARPALRAAVGRIRGQVTRARWSRGTCPACGAAAALGGLRGPEHERRLYCARCGTGWTFPRVRCPSCGEREHERLGLLHPAGERDYRRIEVCESCRAYIKTVALLDEPDADRVVSLDLETAGLDFVAIERGYRRLTAP